MSGHIRHPRDQRQAVCGLPAATVPRWETAVLIAAAPAYASVSRPAGGLEAYAPHP